MSLFSRLLQTVQSWRRRRGGLRTNKRTAVTMEQLDHRQLLSVTFTGNVKNDFPASMSPGVVVIPDNPSVIHPVIAPDLQTLVPVSGFDINGIRVTYTPSDDTLSIGLDQPPSGLPGNPNSVIAGDADDNGNDGTVNPAVTAVRPGFEDFPDFGGSEFMGAFLDLKGTGFADIVAGVSQTDPRSPKLYQVAQAVVNTSQPPTIPGFGTELPGFEGNVYKVNSPVHPNFEFAISHFSQLYLQETGKPLTADSKISIGAFGGSANDLGISEAFFPQQPFTIGQATPPPPPVCPPVSPPVLINPHQNRHVNTAHTQLVRVSILGTSGFDVTKIIPSSVTLGGAHPLFSFTRHVNKDEFLDETFVFDGTQIKLPPGITTATVTGSLTDGTTFSTSQTIFNRDLSFYSAADQAEQQARFARQGADIPNLAAVIAQKQRQAGPGVNFTYTGGSATPAATSALSMALSQRGGGANVTPNTAVPNAAGNTTIPTDGSSLTGPTVSIKKRRPAVTGQQSTPRISPQLMNSMNHYMQSNSASSVGGAT